MVQMLLLSGHESRYNPPAEASWSVGPTFLLRPLWRPVMVFRRRPRPVRRGKGELGTTRPGPSLQPAQAKPGRLEMVSEP